jgi:hypothetical protein
MANKYDKIIKENFEELLPSLFRVALNLDLPRLVDLKDRFQVTLEREMDNLKKVVHDDPSKDFGLHWEIQAIDEDMRARNFFYYGLFYQDQKIPLMQIVVYIGERPAKHILNNQLSMMGVEYNFLVIDLKRIPKDVFLQSDTPEAVLLAILADFGADKPEKVIRQILQKVQKLIGRIPRLEKYQRQLQVLSRLRKLEMPVKKEIERMPIHYEIETDGLYLEGVEKGVEIGVEIGVEKNKFDIVSSMLLQKKYSIEDIMVTLKVTEAYVRKVALEIGVQIEPIS